MKLDLDLIPSTCWFSNVRSSVTRKQWDYIRKQVYSAAWDTCEICGGIGPKHPVEAHEIWSYDDKKSIQKLEGMIALCPDCHGVKHFGFSIISGKYEKALKHFMKVNNLKKKDAVDKIKESFDVWRKRSIFEWTLDISILSNYGIDIEKLNKP